MFGSLASIYNKLLKQGAMSILYPHLPLNAFSDKGEFLAIFFTIRFISFVLHSVPNCTALINWLYSSKYMSTSMLLYYFVFKFSLHCFNYVLEN